MRKLIHILAILIVALGFTTTLLAKQKQTKTNQIIVKGPNVKIEREYTLFQASGNQRPTATQASNYIEADIIKYFSSKNYTISEGNVVFRNLEKKIEINAGYSEFYGNTGDVTFTKSPRMYLSNNNMYIGGEKVYLNVNEDKVNVEKNTFVTNENIKAVADKVEYTSKDNLAKMIGNVSISSSNMNIKSDIAYISIFSNVVSNYIGYGNVVIESKNITSKSEYLIATFKSSNEIDKYLMLTNVILDGKDIYVEAFKMSGFISNFVEGVKTNYLKYYNFFGTSQKQVYYQNKKEETTLECDSLEVIMDENNELISSTAKGKVKVIK
ncbi:MAG: LptA/OstA family protein [Brevinematia bacterium]